MSATVIIPQHGRADLTLACITSIRRHESHPWPILVIDDGSPDKSAQQLTQLLHLQSDHAQLAAPSTKLAGSQCLSNGVFHSSLITVLHQPHRGLTAAWNTAALHSTTPILVFLNNDTIASGPFLQSLILPLQEPHRPPTHPGCGSEQPGCRINRLAMSPSHDVPAPLSPSPPCPALTGVRLRTESSLPKPLLKLLPTRQFLEGWCFAVRRDDLLRLGGFDESMTLYWSDTDFQCRLLQSHEPLLQRPTGQADNSTACPFIAMPHLPLRHLGHQTTHAAPTHRQQWHTDRAAFIRKWSNLQPRPGR